MMFLLHGSQPALTRLRVLKAAALALGATAALGEVDGRQFVVAANGGGKMATPTGDAYVAFALPEPAVS